MIRILHTSDWHLGKELIRESTLPAQRQMTEWLLGVCREREVGYLLLSGDVFDVLTPSNAAQELYYSFLARAVKAGVRAVVVTPGNHDSAGFLRAPATVLGGLGVIVPGPRAEDQAVVIRDEAGEPLLGVAAVPFLRESEVRGSREGITEGDRWALYAAGVAERYEAVRLALDERMPGSSAPRVAMGHFFAAGSAVTPDPETGAVPATVGSLGAIPASVMGEGWDYAALGHIHRAQEAAGPAVRYSGSPVPLSFREADNPTQVVLVTLGSHGEAPEIEPIPVPRFQPIARAEGDADGLAARLERIARESPGAWVEADYTGVSEQPDLNDMLSGLCERLGLRLLAVRNQAAFRRALKSTEEAPPLESWSPEDVFRMYLEESHATDEDAASLTETFGEALALVREDQAARKRREEDISPEAQAGEAEG